MIWHSIRRWGSDCAWRFTQRPTHSPHPPSKVRAQSILLFTAVNNSSSSVPFRSVLLILELPALPSFIIHHHFLGVFSRRSPYAPSYVSFKEKKMHSHASGFFAHILLVCLLVFWLAETDWVVLLLLLFWSGWVCFIGSFAIVLEIGDWNKSRCVSVYIQEERGEANRVFSSNATCHHRSFYLSSFVSLAVLIDKEKLIS